MTPERDIIDTIITEKNNAVKAEEVFKSKTSTFLNERYEEETKLILDCAKALLDVEIEIKELRDDQKRIKTEAKAEGVAVMKVTKTLNLLKRAVNESDLDAREMENMQDILGNNVDIQTMISSLVKKD